MSVLSALEHDLQQMPQAVQDSTLAATARVLAGVLDAEPGARDAAAVAKEIRAALVDLKTLTEAAPEESDPIDELSRRRASRITETPIPESAVGSDQ